MAALVISATLSACLPIQLVSDGSPGCSTAQAQQSPLSGVQTAFVSVNGSPFDVLTVGDVSFVSLGGSIGSARTARRAFPGADDLPSPKRARRSGHADDRYLLTRRTPGPSRLNPLAVEFGPARCSSSEQIERSRWQWQGSKSPHPLRALMVFVVARR